MSHFNLRHPFFPARSGRLLKKMLPGALLALLATPALAGEPSRGNVLTLGGRHGSRATLFGVEWKPRHDADGAGLHNA